MNCFYISDFTHIFATFYMVLFGCVFDWNGLYDHKPTLNSNHNCLLEIALAWNGFSPVLSFYTTLLKMGHAEGILCWLSIYL